MAYDDEPDPGGEVEFRTRTVVEYGIDLDGVWLPLPMLRRLNTHGPWDAPFTEATADQERVLVAHALADRHNHRGLHRGTGLRGLLDAIPYEPTVPFEKIPPADGGGANGADGANSRRAGRRGRAPGPRGDRS